jgi:spore germination protein KA
MLFDFFARKLRYINDSKRHQSNSGDEEQRQPEIVESLSKNLEELKQLLGTGSDLKIHFFRFGEDSRYSGVLVYFDGLVDSTVISDTILRPIVNWRQSCERALLRRELVEILCQEVMCSADTESVQTINELAGGCLSGDVALLINGCPTGLIISAKGWDQRSVAEPPSESVVRGPREGFTENLRTNTALIRRRIKTGKLRADMLTVGKKTKTGVCLMYLEGVANTKVVDEVKFRIKQLDIDSILDSGNIEEYIEDAPFSPFPTVGYSEKPDVIASRVLEGRVAIIVDGTPFVLTAPMLFIESFQTAEDYYTRTIYANIIRMLRYLAFLLSVFGPGIYVALTSYHQELIPTTLLFTIANAREGTPFPVFIEALVMVFAYELLREGGIRLPHPVGQAISIVGALIMGDAAVSAGVVSAPIVIAIAITAVAGFLVPMQNESSSILRFIMLFLSAGTGFYGLSLGFLAMLIHLSTLTSFGVPYFDGFAITRNLQDSIVRMPLWSMVMRPKYIAKGDLTRRRFFIPPLRPYSMEDDDLEEGT